jgi:hypothetical protein
MSAFTGIAMILLSGVLYLKYSPKSKDGRLLCMMTGMMGIMSLIVSSGSWGFQLIQLGLQIVVGLCCFVQLKREKILRARRRAACRHVHRPGSEPQSKVKTCA